MNLKEWKILKRLGKGGNGAVYACRKNRGEVKAIKYLTKTKNKAYKRFLDEIKIIEQNSDITGIIPIEEKYLPENLMGEKPFYVMPLAESAEHKLKDKPIQQVIEAIIQVTETLSELHKRKIYHRDIKPANILYYKSRFSLADFGLADYPDKEDVSMVNEEIGAKWTIAPEMRRDSSTADVAKADIYSLAKTLWIFLTGINKGFDGQYSIDSIIHLRRFHPDIYTSIIDDLLIACTDNNPERRPSADEFISYLQKWKEFQKDFGKRNQQQWLEIQTKLFPSSMPKRVIWDDNEDIIKVLKTVCYYNNLNHLLFPDGGGLDLADVRLSHEEGCIELDFGSIDILKPKRLVFESFKYSYDWNYFRLEADELKPAGVEKSEEESLHEEHHGREHLSELTPLNYFPYYVLENISDYEHYYEINETSRQVTRWFRGSFLIISKSSVYNSIPSTYDGRHNKMTTDEFREHMQTAADYIKKRKEEKFAESVEIPIE